MSFADIAHAFAHHGGRLFLALPDDPDEDPAERASRVRCVTVMADDGVELYAEVQKTAGARLTVVFCHGYLLNSTSWHLQRTALGASCDVVLWDQRGHGRSGWGTPPNATIEQVGRDLFAVLEATAPHGPVLLVGHSMGGMAILGLAESHPDLFGDRVVGVVLSSTSAGGLSSITAGLPVRTARVMHRLVPVTLATLRRQARLVDGARRSVSGLSYWISWPYLYGTRVPKPVAKLTTQLMASVPIRVIAEFYKELIVYDLRSALPVLGRVPVLVMVGERDLITPIEHAQVLVSAIPGAELVVVPDAGHLLILECPGDITQHVSAMIENVTSPAPARQAGKQPGRLRARRRVDSPCVPDARAAEGPPAGRRRHGHG